MPGEIDLERPAHRVLRRRVTSRRGEPGGPAAGDPELRPRKAALFALGVVVVVAFAVVALGGAGNAAAAGRWYRWVPALAGVLVGGGFMYAGSSSGRPRYHAVAAYSVAAGVSVSLPGIGGPISGVLMYLAVMSVTLVAWTALALAGIVTVPPVPTPGQGDAGD